MKLAFSVSHSATAEKVTSGPYLAQSGASDHPKLPLGSNQFQ